MNTDWVMPEWMERYREYFNNTGGNSVENLMNDKSTNNNVRSVLAISVASQVILLRRLYDKNELAVRPNDLAKERLTYFATWLLSLDDPDNEERKTITMNKILEKAREALSVEQK